MNKERKVLFVLAIVVVAIATGVLFQKRREKAPSEEPIRIGGIYTFTGVASDIGEAMRRGTEIALTEINSQGGVQGHNLEIIYEDAPDLAAKGAINAAQKLINIDRVKLVLDMPYSGLGAIQPMAESSQVPVVDILDSSDEIAGLGDWIFGGGIYANGVGQHVAEYAYNQLKVRKVAILAGKDEYVLAVSGGFEDAFKKLGGEVVVHEEFLVGESDFRASIAKIQAGSAEAIFVGHLGEGGLAIKQAAELGYKGYFLGSDTFSLGEVQKTAGSILNGTTYFALWRNFDVLTPEQEKFVQRYQELFGELNNHYLFYTVLGYDGLKVAAEAMRNSDLSGKGIQQALYEIDNYPGLSGPITIDGTSINRDPKSAIVTYKNSEIVRAE